MTKEEKLANKMIEEMQELGLTPDQMLKCIRGAREMYKDNQKKVCEHNNRHGVNQCVSRCIDCGEIFRDD